MSEKDFVTTVIRRLSNLENHIVNLIFPIQEINNIFRDKEQLNQFVQIFKEPLKVDVKEFTSLISELRNCIREFSTDIDKINLGNTYAEIKFIGKKISEITESLSKIEEEGIKKQINLELTCEGYEMVKKPKRYDPKEPVEHPDDDLQKILEGLSLNESNSIVHHFGYCGETNKNMVSIGKQLKIHPDTARNCFDRGIRKIKRNIDKVKLVKNSKYEKLKKYVLF